MTTALIALITLVLIAGASTAAYARGLQTGLRIGHRRGQRDAAPGCPPIMLPQLVHDTIAGAPHPVIGITLANAIVNACTRGVQRIGHPTGPDAPAGRDELTDELDALWDLPAFGDGDETDES